MIDSDLSKFEFSKIGWRQSIAVSITAQIIWVIVPIVFVCSIFIFNMIEKDLSSSFSYKVDALTHRITNIILNKVELTREQKDKIIQQISIGLGFQAIEVSAPNYKLTTTNNTEGYIAITRTLPLIGHSDEFENSFIVVTCYHLPLEQVLAQKQKNILAITLSCLIVFSIFLVISIRNWLYKPLKSLIDATGSVSNGNTHVNLDTERKDEFGYLSTFFKYMIARLAKQHDELREAANSASKANSAKSGFLANMSHELRTPLNAIIGYSEMMLDNAIEKSDEIYIEDLKKSISASKHLLHLINEVLDLSKIEAGKMEIHLSRIDIKNLLMETTTTVDPLIKRNNNILQVECDTNIDYFDSDATKVQQVLLNLLGNACKFTENGTITLVVKNRFVKNVMSIDFTVKDTGIGIEKENLDLLFNPFTQENNLHTRSYTGTGLGLSISQHFCHLLGGEITVKSTKGKGSSFTATLPVETPASIQFDKTEDTLPMVSTGN